MGAVIGSDVLGRGLLDDIRVSGRVSCKMRILSLSLSSVDVLWITTTLSFGCWENIFIGEGFVTTIGVGTEDKWDEVGVIMLPRSTLAPTGKGLICGGGFCI